MPLRPDATLLMYRLLLSFDIAVKHCFYSVCCTLLGDGIFRLIGMADSRVGRDEWLAWDFEVDTWI